ncbi:MAG TPA: hypothetical protein VF054_18675 [Micromonosporaceae bacterium]
MSNTQQPEMRRSGRDPLVQDSAKAKATSGSPGGDDRGKQPVPPEQQSPYGPGGPDRE